MAKQQLIGPLSDAINAAITKLSAMHSDQELADGLSHTSELRQLGIRMTRTAVRLRRAHLGIASPLSGRPGNHMKRDVPKIVLTEYGYSRDDKGDTAEKTYRDFAKIWNDHTAYPATYDLERAFNMKIASVRARASKYTKFRLAHPALRLPELIWRKATTGGMITAPRSIVRQLDQFRFDPEKLQGARGVVITAAQLSAPLNTWVWQSLKKYAEYRGFPLIVGRIKYGRLRTRLIDGERRLTSTFPEELKGHMVLENLALIPGELEFNLTSLRPTLGRFLTDDVCAMGDMASQIFAAPKLELEHRPRVGRRYPKAIMTTGAVTHPNYDVDNLGQQSRVCEVAIANHTYSAIVIEFGEGKLFHFRQLHANKRGEFYDIDPIHGGARLFTPRGNQHCPDDIEAIVMGDLHLYKEDPAVMRATFEEQGIVSTLRPKHLVTQDTFDHDGVSWFDERNATRKSWKAIRGFDLVEDELRNLVRKLEWIKEHAHGAQIHVIPGNHDEMLSTWVQRKEYNKDARNERTGRMLHVLVDEDMDSRHVDRHNARPYGPVMLYINRHCSSGIWAYDRKEAVQFPVNARKPILILHGDIGVRGKETRGTREFKKMNQRVILGHNHSARIEDTVWRVGVKQRRSAHYVNAPATDWTNTDCAIFKNGQRQLINIVRGRWHGYVLPQAAETAA